LGDISLQNKMKPEKQQRISEIIKALNADA